MPDPLAPPGTDRNSVPLRTARSTDDNRQDALHIDRHQFLPTEAALRIEGLCGQPEKMADGARVVRDFQPPFGAVSKPRDGVADHVRACHCGFVPCHIVVPHIDGDVA
jgi:hypothetical protein